MTTASSAQDLVREGNLTDALAEVESQIRRAPAEPKPRIFLAQLLAVLGQWDRANTQLEVAADLDGLAIPMAQTYREALRCELLREQVFAGTQQPTLFGEPEPWMAMLLEAVKHSAAARFAEAKKLTDEAFEIAPATPGRIDGQAFEWIADADMRYGPFLEAVVNGSYYWIPFQRIARVRLDAPSDLRDLVWMSAQFQWTNGGEAVGLIPARYPATHESSNASLRLARKTDWVEHVPGYFIGYGQRMLATDAGEYPLLEARSIELGAASPE